MARRWPSSVTAIESVSSSIAHTHAAPSRWLQMLSVSLWSRKSVRTAGHHEVHVGRYAYSTNSERTCGGAISIGSSRIEGRRKDGKSADGEGGSY